MRKNTMKEKLKAGSVVAGVVVNENSPATVERLALAGFDWIFIDCEHSPLSEESVSLLIMAAELRGTTPLVRVPMNVPELILRYMDAGAMGIIIPGLDSPESAQTAVKAVKYQPLGERGLSSVRAADFGMTGPLGEYVKRANDETMVLGVIENANGVENIRSILETEGFDGVIIGTNDLSNSLGVAGQTTHPRVVEAVGRILEAGKATGKPIGGVLRPGETPKQYVEKGFRMLLTSAAGLLGGAAKQFMATVPR
jgi:4-hydroxy-2-oxoheptanedioate aldolase